MADKIAPTQGVEPRELLCMVCNRDYPVWYTPNSIWNKVMRPTPDASDELPFICPTCFAMLAEQRGIVSTAWCLAPEQPVTGVEPVSELEAILKQYRKDVERGMDDLGEAVAKGAIERLIAEARVDELKNALLASDTDEFPKDMLNVCSHIAQRLTELNQMEGKTDE